MNQFFTLLAGLALGISLANTMQNRDIVKRINAIEIKLEMHK